MSRREQKKNDAKLRVQKKQRQRRLLTFVRMCRYGVHNFSRNAWLTLAATAVMSVTLLIIFMTVSARQILLDTVSGISKQTDMSIYLKGSTPEKDALEMKQKLEKLPNVDSVRYVSAAEAREQQAQSYKDDTEALEAIKESSNEMSATLRVSLKDLSDHSALVQFTENDEQYKQLKDPRRKPSFSNDRQQAINTISEWVRLASVAGSIVTVIFVAISSLVVFNTIRMAIFNRKDEIQMMKLIGAERSFIRGPFIVEAVMYGFIAAIVATGVGYGLILLMEGPLSGYGIPMQHLIDIITTYMGFVLLAMILIGAIIGVISSFIATRKYLKI